MSAHPKNKPQATLFVVFAALMLGIGTADYFFYRDQTETIKEQAQQQLSTIADLKVQQITNWRKERLGDAYVLRENIFIRVAVSDWLRLGLDAEQQGQICQWLQSYVVRFDYREALLLDPQGKILAATPDSLPIVEPTLQLLRSATDSRAPAFGNVHEFAGNGSYMELATPLYNPGNQRLLGFVVFRIDPRRFLFPLLQSWPVPSQSAETLLIERQGDSIVYLNELRHRKGTALRPVLPADQETLPAALAASGITQVMEGEDYRGVKVLAATRPVPETSWSMVAKIDMSEVRAPLLDRFYFLLAISALALLAALGMTLYLSRLQRHAGWQQEADERKAAREIARAHDRLLAAQDIGRIGSWEREINSQKLWWSEEIYRLFDYPPASTTPTLDLFYARIHPDDRELVRRTVAESAAQGKRYHIPYRVILPSGEIRCFENTSRIVSDNAGYPIAIAGTTQDVTEHRRIEEQSRRQSVQLAAVLENLPMGISVFDEKLRLQLWNPSLIDVLGLPPELVTPGVAFEDLVRYRAQIGEYGPGDPEEQVRERVNLALGFAPHRFEHTRGNGRTNLIQGRPYDIDGQLAGFITTYTDITDRKQAETELQRQHTLLHTIIENIPSGVSLIDGNLDFVGFNQEFCRLLEFPAELMAKKLLGMRDIVLFNAQRGEYGPGDPEALADALIEKARDPVPHHFERARPNGTIIEIRGTPLQGGGFVTAYTDITARKRAELALQMISERLTLATSAAAIGIWDWNLAGDTMIWDARMFELYGIDPQINDDAHRHWMKQVHPDDLPLVNAALQACHDGGADHFDIDFRIIQPNRQIRYLNAQILVERDGNKKPMRMVGANIDITKRKQSDERLLLAEKVFDNSPDAIMITDQYNRIVSVNAAFALITGYTTSEVLGKDPRILASGIHDTAFYRKMWEALKRYGHWAGEITDRRKNGETYPKWMTINEVTDAPRGKLTHYVTIFSDITERKSAEERIHYLAHHDALTALPNRFSLESRLEQACLDARRHHWDLAVLFIDLDRFKVINDTLGHNVGDQLLIEVARRLTAAVRESDTVARLGGDEFVIILPDMNSPNDAAGVAAKIIAALSEPIPIDNQQLHTSPSIGISVYPTDGTDADTIMRNADTAMYHAKALGRNNFQFYAEEMNRNASERLDIESRLRHALVRKEFELHYQPQLTTKGTEVVGVEALLRWNPADGRSVTPARFIPIAEDTGMIIAIGEWVLRTACRQIKAWLDTGIPSLRLAINVSARQLRKQDFPDIVASALSESGLPAHLLEIEITESAVMEEPEEARLILERLKEMGVTLAIDDFGTGYSSLAYLKLFPIDNLKIDRSFVTDIGRHADDAAIAISTIALAHSLGINVIAEGVETDTQLDLLRTHHCNEFQGFLFSRPLPAADALAFLQRAASDPKTIA